MEKIKKKEADKDIKGNFVEEGQSKKHSEILPLVSSHKDTKSTTTYGLFPSEKDLKTR